MTLVEQFESYAAGLIDERGIYLHPCMWLNAEGKFNVAALDLKPDQVYVQVFNTIIKEKPSELIFGLDRFTKEGQGTTLGDVLVGGHWTGSAWRVFVMEYQNEPRIVKPFDWDNEYWKQAIRKEITSMCDATLLGK